MRLPIPPFTESTASEKVRLAEDGWNSRDPEKVSLAYTPDSQWRNRDMFVSGRSEIVNFLRWKWCQEHEYRLVKELFAFQENRIAVRYAYEYRNYTGNWFRAYGNENWEFTDGGLMKRRYASINDLPIREEDRRLYWPLGRRPDTYPGLSELGL